MCTCDARGVCAIATRSLALSGQAGSHFEGGPWSGTATATAAAALARAADAILPLYDVVALGSRDLRWAGAGF